MYDSLVVSLEQEWLHPFKKKGALYITRQLKCTMDDGSKGKLDYRGRRDRCGGRKDAIPSVGIPGIRSRNSRAFRGPTRLPLASEPRSACEYF